MKRIVFFALVVVLMWGNFASGQESDGVPYTITLDPIADINPVKTQHTLIATVLDKSGKPLPGQRVEWILARDPYKGVGDIVEHDDMRAMVGTQKIEKIANNYTVSYTNERPEVRNMGTETTKDDIQLGIGQTWLTITSPVEGETHIIAFCPNIRNANRHKTFAIKYWIDAKIGWPEDAVNKVGTPHVFQFTLRKASNNAPLQGHRVKWSLDQPANAPAAYFGENKTTKEMDTETNEEGVASVVLNQINPAEGVNRVKIELRKPTGELLAVRHVIKRWIAPKVTITKSGPKEGIIEELVVYTIDLSNPGDAESNDVVVKDQLPEGMVYEACTVVPSKIEGKTLIWDIGTLPKDAARKFVLTVRAKQIGTWTNQVIVSSRQATPQTSSVTTVVGAPELYIIKKGPELLRLGMLGNYEVTVKNNGNALARDVFIRDLIPAGMKFREITDGTGLRWNVGEMTPKSSRTFRYTLETIKTGVFTNEAQVYMKHKEGAVHKAFCKTVVVAPILKLTKQGQPVVFLNKPASYDITVVNEGTGSGKNLILVDRLPKQLDYISSTPRGVFRPGRGDQLATITWKIGDLEPKKQRVINLQVRANSIGRCRNSVKLTSETAEPPQIIPLEAHADTNIIGVPAMHINSYDTEDPVEVGKQTIYVIECRNEGTSPCTNVIMANHLDDEMEFLSASGPVTFKVKGNDVLFDPVPILQPGEKLIYKIVCKAVKEGSAKNTATLRYDQFTKPIIDEEGTSIYR